MIFAPLDVLRDISETLCIYNMLYATNQLFYQSIFSVFWWGVFFNAHRLYGFKIYLGIFLVMLKSFSIYKYQYIVLFFT